MILTLPKTVILGDKISSRNRRKQLTEPKLIISSKTAPIQARLSLTSNSDATRRANTTHNHVELNRSGINSSFKPGRDGCDVDERSNDRAASRVGGAAYLIGAAANLGEHPREAGGRGQPRPHQPAYKDGQLDLHSRRRVESHQPRRWQCRQSRREQPEIPLSAHRVDLRAVQVHGSALSAFHRVRCCQARLHWACGSISMV